MRRIDVPDGFEPRGAGPIIRLQSLARVRSGATAAEAFLDRARRFETASRQAFSAAQAVGRRAGMAEAKARHGDELVAAIAALAGARSEVLTQAEAIGLAIARRILGTLPADEALARAAAVAVGDDAWADDEAITLALSTHATVETKAAFARLFPTPATLAEDPALAPDAAELRGAFGTIDLTPRIQLAIFEAALLHEPDGAGSAENGD